MTEPSQPPDWVRAWAIAHGCEISKQEPPADAFRAVGYCYQVGDDWSTHWEPIPSRDSGDYFMRLVMAAKDVSFEHLDNGTVEVAYQRWHTQRATLGEDPDPVSALIAAVNAAGWEVAVASYRAGMEIVFVRSRIPKRGSTQR